MVFFSHRTKRESPAGDQFWKFSHQSSILGRIGEQWVAISSPDLHVPIVCYIKAKKNTVLGFWVVLILSYWEQQQQRQQQQQLTSLICLYCCSFHSGLALRQFMKNCFTLMSRSSILSEKQKTLWHKLQQCWFLINVYLLL